MEQAVPGMKLVWASSPSVFLLAVLTQNSEAIFQFALTKEEVKSLSAEIDRYLLQVNGSLLHLPFGVKDG